MNRKTMTLSTIIIVAAGTGLPMATVQADADSLPTGILACANEDDVMVRLACYDREVAALVALPPMPVAPPKSADTPSVAPAKGRAVALADAPTAAVPVPPATKPAAEEKVGFGYDRHIEGITASVVEIRERPYGELIIRLDNGQVWEQSHVDRRFKLRIGETVTIKKGAFSGYRLSGTSNRSIQVTRRK